MQNRKTVQLMETIITLKVMKTILSVVWEDSLIYNSIAQTLKVAHVALSFGIRAGERVAEPLTQRLILPVLLLDRLLARFLVLRKLIGIGT